MNKVILILLILPSYSSIAQFSITGNVIDFSDDSFLYYSIVTLIDESTNDTIKQILTDYNGTINFQELDSRNYAIGLSYIGFHNVLIKNINLNGNINLCNLYMYGRGHHWDGPIERKKLFGIISLPINTKKMIVKSYLEENTNRKGKIRVKYFCNENVDALFKNNYLIIKYK